MAADLQYFEWSVEHKEMVARHAAELSELDQAEARSRFDLQSEIKRLRAALKAKLSADEMHSLHLVLEDAQSWRISANIQKYQHLRDRTKEHQKEELNDQFHKLHGPGLADSDRPIPTATKPAALAEMTVGENPTKANSQGPADAQDMPTKKRKTSTDKTSPASTFKKSRLSQPIDQPLTDRKLRFDQVFDHPSQRDFIVEYQGHWYILYCEEHQIQFKRNAIAAAAKHLNGEIHGRQDKNWSNAVRKLGKHVEDCTADLAEMNNKKVEEALASGYRLSRLSKQRLANGTGVPEVGTIVKLSNNKNVASEEEESNADTMDSEFEALRDRGGEILGDKEYRDGNFKAKGGPDGDLFSKDTAFRMGDYPLRSAILPNKICEKGSDPKQEEATPPKNTDEGSNKNAQENVTKQPQKGLPKQPERVSPRRPKASAKKADLDRQTGKATLLAKRSNPQRDSAASLVTQQHANDKVSASTQASRVGEKPPGGSKSASANDETITIDANTIICCAPAEPCRPVAFALSFYDDGGQRWERGPTGESGCLELSHSEGGDVLHATDINKAIQINPRDFDGFRAESLIVQGVNNRRITLQPRDRAKTPVSLVFDRGPGSPLKPGGVQNRHFIQWLQKQNGDCKLLDT